MTALIEVEVWECIPPTKVGFPPTTDLDTPTDFLTSRRGWRLLHRNRRFLGTNNSVWRLLS
jgi:hypothetical protein